jgi:glycerol uptake facilitator-like aquaporin
MPKKIFAEFIGVAALLTSVIGSGIMATNLTSDVGLQLIINAISIVSMLGIIIYLIGPISGAHFNPLVTLSELYFRRIAPKAALGYILAQFLGGITGTAIANVMFSKPIFFASHHIRSGNGVLLGEVIATAGLLGIIQLLQNQNKTAQAPIVICAWITTGFFFTSSFIFANPAVTFARAWSDSFSGIAPSSVAMFILAQSIGAVIGVFGSRALFIKEK